LQDLEETKADLGITSYGLSVTTLEEVFLAVSAAASEEAKAKKHEAAKLQPKDEHLQGSNSAVAGNADEDFLDPKAEMELPQDEQPSARKPYTLLKVELLLLAEYLWICLPLTVLACPALFCCRSYYVQLGTTASDGTRGPIALAIYLVLHPRCHDTEYTLLCNRSVHSLNITMQAYGELFKHIAA